jgi:hypothetical protein
MTQKEREMAACFAAWPTHSDNEELRDKVVGKARMLGYDVEENPIRFPVHLVMISAPEGMKFVFNDMSAILLLRGDNGAYAEALDGIDKGIKSYWDV